MDKKFCSYCGCENDINGNFCKKCGAKLPQISNNGFYAGNSQANPNGGYYPPQGQPPMQQPPVYQPPQQPVPPPYYQNQQYPYQQPYYTPQPVQQPVVQIVPPPQPPQPDENAPEVDFDGVTGSELYAYTGSKRIMDKFSKMKFTNSKISWCWPAFVLGIFLGFLGSAVWFMYRKMYKLAIILAVVGVLLQSASYYVLGEATLLEEFIDAGKSFTQSSDYGSLTDLEDADEPSDELTYVEDSLRTASTKEMIWNTVEAVIYIAVGVFSGIFALYFYYRHSVKKVKEYQNKGIEKEYYYEGLETIGGSIGGMLALVIFGLVVLIFGLEVAAGLIFGM